MKSNFNYPELNSDFLIKFINMNLNEQSELLRREGILVDCDIENGRSTSLFYLQGFFAEETISVSENKILEIIPFKQGYKVEKYFEVKQVLALKSTNESR
jgi:hypothetical protein